MCRRTLRAFRAAGVTPDVIQIGNEITSGLGWPLGCITGRKGSAEQPACFDRLASLLNAGVGGDVQPRVQWFFDAITIRHVRSHWQHPARLRFPAVNPCARRP